MLADEIFYMCRRGIAVSLTEDLIKLNIKTHFVWQKKRNYVLVHVSVCVSSLWSGLPLAKWPEANPPTIDVHPNTVQQNVIVFKTHWKYYLKN